MRVSCGRATNFEVFMTTIDLTGDAWEREVIESSERHQLGLAGFSGTELEAKNLPSGTVLLLDGQITYVNRAGVFESPLNMKVPRSGTVALVGCSVTQMNRIGAGLYGDSRQCDFGWANWLCHYLGGFDIAHNFAVGGATTGPNASNLSSTNNVLNQLPAALAADTDWIIGDFGILNDAMQKADVAITCDYIDQILNSLASKNCIMINSTPLLAGGTWSTSTIMNYICQVNAYLQRAVQKYPNVILIDAYSAIVNPVTGYAKTGLIQGDDYVHYLQNTCRAIAVVGKAALAGLVSIVDAESPKSQADVYHATYNPNRAQSNPKLIGSGGTALSGITGTVPAGCALSKAGTSFTGTSTVDATNGGWTVAITAAGAANDQLFVTLATATDGWAQSGDVLRGGFKFALSGAANLLSMQCQIGATVDGTYKIITTCLEPDNSDGTHVQSTIDLSDMTITVRLPGGVIPTGSSVTGVKLLFAPKFSSASAAATMKFTDAWLEKVPS